MPKTKRKKARAMWLVRAGNSGFLYYVCTHRPQRTVGGTWYEDSATGSLARISVRQSPVELKPGEGPVKVRLVVDEE